MLLPDHQSKLHTCKQNPRDDSLRLALADALDASGEPERAELVRIQIRRARSASDWYPGKAEDEAREIELKARFTAAWSGGQVAPGRKSWFQFGGGGEDDAPSLPAGQFQRGLIRISSDAHHLHSAIDHIPTRALPWLEALDVRGVTSDLGELRRAFERPEVREFTTLSFAWTGDAPPGVIDLADRPTVRSLSPGGGEGNGQLIRRLAAARSLRPHALSTAPDPGDPESWAALMGSPVGTSGCAACGRTRTRSTGWFTRRPWPGSNTSTFRGRLSASRTSGHWPPRRC